MVEDATPIRIGCSSSARVTATVTATSANCGERWRTLADESLAICVQGERWRTTTNAGELRATGLENHLGALGHGFY
jgi:hypothetical protein